MDRAVAWRDSACLRLGRSERRWKRPQRGNNTDDREAKSNFDEAVALQSRYGSRRQRGQEASSIERRNASHRKKQQYFDDQQISIFRRCRQFDATGY
jgi:hypothetical protein